MPKKFCKSGPFTQVEDFRFNCQIAEAELLHEITEII